jgi:tRNA-binding protein
MIEYSDFGKVDIRVGRIVKVENFPEAINPSYKLEIDFGEEIGKKKSSAHITNYDLESLSGRTVIAVVNFKPKQVANFMSEVLVLGVSTDKGVMLLSVDESGGTIEPGVRIS